MAASFLSTLTTISQFLLPASLFFLAGIATSLAVWIVPLVLLPSTPSRTLIHQFNETVRRGGAYLQPSSRSLALVLIATTALTYLQSDPAWKFHAAAGLLLMQTAWWEVVFIFPINDEIAAMEGKLRGEDAWTTKSEHAKLHNMVRSWRLWHLGRIATPFIAGCLTLAALL